MSTNGIIIITWKSDTYTTITFGGFTIFNVRFSDIHCFINFKEDCNCTLVFAFVYCKKEKFLKNFVNCENANIAVILFRFSNILGNWVSDFVLIFPMF